MITQHCERPTTSLLPTPTYIKQPSSHKRLSETHSETILYCTILYYTILYYTILYILYYISLYYTILYYTILYYTILYYTIYTILYYTIGTTSFSRIPIGQKVELHGSPQPFLRTGGQKSVSSYLAVKCGGHIEIRMVSIP